MMSTRAKSGTSGVAADEEVDEDNIDSIADELEKEAAAAAQALEGTDGEAADAEPPPTLDENPRASPIPRYQQQPRTPVRVRMTPQMASQAARSSNRPIVRPLPMAMPSIPVRVPQPARRGRPPKNRGRVDSYGTSPIRSQYVALDMRDRTSYHERSFGMQQPVASPQRITEAQLVSLEEEMCKLEQELDMYDEAMPHGVDPNANEFDETENEGIVIDDDHDVNVVDRNTPPLIGDMDSPSVHGKLKQGAQIFYECADCLSLFKRSSALIKHRQEKHGVQADAPQNFVCPACEHYVGTKSALKQHIEEYHKDLTEICACKICDRYFRTPEQLMKHERIHSDYRPFQCPVCHKGYPWREHLQAHLKTHFPEKEFVCSECQQSFSSSSALHKHMRFHSDTFRYRCNVCDEGFHLSEPYKIHMRRHADIRPYQCGECGKTYFSRAACKRHTMSHTDHRPFKCTLCGKAFRDRQTLQRHHLAHSGAKPFKCPYCGLGLATKHNAQMHVKKIHPERTIPEMFEIAEEGPPMPEVERAPARTSVVTRGNLHMLTDSIQDDDYDE